MIFSKQLGIIFDLRIFEQIHVLFGFEGVTLSMLGQAIPCIASHVHGKLKRALFWVVTALFGKVFLGLSQRIIPGSTSLDVITRMKSMISENTKNSLLKCLSVRVMSLEFRLEIKAASQTPNV